MKAILALMITTWSEVKISPEKIQACLEFEPMTFAILVKCSANRAKSQLGAGHFVGSK